MEPNAILESLQGDLKTFIERYNGEVKTLGSAQTETKEALDKIQKQIDAIDTKMQRGGMGVDGEKSFEQMLRDDDSVKELLTKHRGRARIEIPGKSLSDILSRKAITASGLGFSTVGVMPTDRDGGITLATRPQLRMRDVLPSRPTSFARIDWVRESVRPTKASPVAENALKPSSDLTLVADSEYVRTLAICTTVSNQVIDDYAELLGFLRNEFADRVREEEDRQILFGDNTGENLNGLTTQAQAWDLTLLTASDGYEYIDIISGAMQQIAEDNEEMSRQFVVMHPGDWWKIRRTKDTTGRYILGDPQTPVAPTLWGAPVVDTTQMTKGYFLVGSGAPRAGEIRDRMGVTIDLSTEDGDNFRYNRVTVRAESRLALVVKRPDAFVYGALTQSPA